MTAADIGKRAAAEAAIALVDSGMRLGLGTGSTMRYALDALARRMRDDGLTITGIPTSEATATQARGLGIPLGDAAAFETLDLALDGADEVERGTLHLIKGLGGALLREKIVMQASRRFVVVVDHSKIVARLGTRAPLPVEIAPFGHAATARRIADLGGAPVLRLSGGVPFVSDGGHLIYDCPGFRDIDDPCALDRRLTAIAGVVETGLFVDPVEQCIVGAADGTVSVLRPVAAAMPAVARPVIAVLMGVSGSGKSTIAALLAAALGCPFQEGDDLHPPENIEKMHAGTPLSDADRLPWLRSIAEVIDGWRARGQSGALTCSALKRAYRDIIVAGRPGVALVYLKGSYDLIRRRMAARHEHFMPVALLDSQFATLEEPGPDEHPVIVDIGSTPPEIAAEIMRRLAERDRETRPAR